jgi:hypothetical protein
MAKDSFLINSISISHSLLSLKRDEIKGRSVIKWRFNGASADILKNIEKCF